MSRIQNLLNKAERDGTVRRTRALVDDGAPGAMPEPRQVAPAAPNAAPRPRLDIVEHMRPESGRPEPVRPVETPPWTEPLSASVEPGRIDSHLIAALAQTSLAAEQYRSLRARIRRAEAGKSVRTILITSPAKGDGKSLTAANLALTMAQEFQQRVLLLDADLRRPAVHQLFGLTGGPGLSDVLIGAAELDDALTTLPEYNLTVLQAGVPPSHPTELLGSSTMRRTLDTLRGRFDKILIDMPPVAPLADTHVVAPLVDGVLMVVRAGVTPKPAIERALAGLDLSKVLGLVLNESDAPSTDYDTYTGYRYIGG
jgi:capsular exopolysaccharide synthesis family protein